MPLQMLAHLRRLSVRNRTRSFLISALHSALLCQINPKSVVACPHSALRSRHYHSRTSNSNKSPKMSWMDSWSRPRKDQATPAPYYLLPGGEDTPYCRSCGRVISSRRTTHAAGSGGGGTPARYCSAKCKSRKPGPVDWEIERVFVQYLEGEEAVPVDERGGKASKGAKGGAKKKKGDPRILVKCNVVQEKVFGSAERHDLHDDEGGSGSEPEHDDAPDSGQRRSGEGSTASGQGDSGEAVKDMGKRMDKGLKTAREKEMVRCAARRGVVFGFKVGSVDVEESEQSGVVVRKCEAVMNGKVAEPSFAKGNWGIRWRED